MRVSGGCGAFETPGARCGRPVEADARLGLCRDHLLAAHEWISGSVGVTDVLPSPCQACGSRPGVRYSSGWLCATCEWRLGETPDEDAAPPRVDVVYYLRFRDRIKIGTSSNPRIRLAQLRFDDLLAFERGDRATEQKRHAQFAASRFPGSEWFRETPELTRHIVALATGVTDPWDGFARWRSESIAMRT
ncbi:MAG TPA: GIY-YIG nuclease family protein [Galbitalea sp.]|jgi:hypothetical protein|nr:GIY-YIG nuclease family protein [Galbitalea sp.]